MFAAGEQAEDTGRVLFIFRFAQHMIIYNDDGIGAENAFVLLVGKNYTRLFARHSLGEVARRLTFHAYFGDVRGFHYELNPGVLQELLAARRS
jgi:hypothetical protein